MSDGDFRAIFEGALDPMLLADDDARYVDANPAACAFLGLSRAEICSLRVVDLAPEPARAAFHQVWQTFLQDGAQQGEYQLQLPDGRTCDIEFSATADVLPGRHLSIMRDVTERKRRDAERERRDAERERRDAERERRDAERDQQIARAQELARTDPLTGLPNRRVWTERIAVELHRAARSHEPLTVAVLDLDDLKTLNDTQGHAAGDRLLQTVSVAWQQQLRETDLLARVGGDEFWLLFPACPAGVEDGLLARMRAAMPPGQSFSVGTATWDGTESSSQLLVRADQALYQAKAGKQHPPRGA
jgi:diguanylate cyclase (GGDEF)-like protein/PAS domain S-box-containing protein